MSKKPQNQRPEERPEDSPAAWFVVLERARRASDAKLVEKAQRELRRLGVEVAFTPNAKGVQS